MKRRGPLTLLMTTSGFRWVIGMLFGLPVLYLALFGPACWLESRNALLLSPVNLIYQPLFRLAWNASPKTRQRLNEYAQWGAAPRWHIEWSGVNETGWWTKDRY